MSRIMRLITDDRGATAIEYGLVVALIALAVIGSVNVVADETIGMWNFISDTLDNAVT
jgi:pilus assembly protein Flp/PilA